MKRKYQQTVASTSSSLPSSTVTTMSSNKEKEDISATTVDSPVLLTTATIDINKDEQQPLQQHRPHKKPSLIYPPLPRPRRDIESLAELIEEFDLNRYRYTVHYNALLTNFRGFIEGEKDNIRQSQKFKNSFKNYKDLRSTSCRIHEQSTHALSVLRSTVQRLQEIRIHEAEVENICETQKNENNVETNVVIEGSKNLRMKKLKEDGCGSESSSLTSTKQNYEDSDEDDDESDSFDMA